MLGVDRSMVAGRFTMALRAGVAPQVSVTASQISFEKSSSVALKVSGEYSKPQSVALSAAARSRIWAAARVAISRTPARSFWKTTRRNTGAVAL